MREGRQSMGHFIQVKKPLLLATLLFLAPACGFAAEETPDPLAVLRSVRMAEISQHMVLVGRLRSGAKSIPLRIVMDGTTIRYELAAPPITLLLKLGEKGSKLEEVTQSGSEKVAGSRYDTLIPGADISYEDIALRFVYWPKAVLKGEETRMFQKCWIVEATPGDVESQYSRVLVWVDKEHGEMLEAEAYDKAGKLARRFTVRSAQKVDGGYILKQMRIEGAATTAAKEPPITYLEISGEEK